MKPMLSIIIPTFNCKEFLEEGMQSVLTQLPDECELIMVDDGSIDGTAELLSEYIDKKSNLRIFLCEHKGASGARNKGLDMAEGEYAAFIDCDDHLKKDFMKKGLPMLEGKADLYIFGIQRIYKSGVREFWTVDDRVFSDVSSFADEYIINRHLMIYSNCNKFYKRSIIEKLKLRFDEKLEFGEDRLFNFKYISGCGKIITSSLIMLNYIQRNATSLSTKHMPGYFECIKMLHREKINCFFELSKGTTEEEKLDFAAYDLSREIEKTIDRFAEHPEEIEENLPEINRIIFEGSCDIDAPVDAIVVLGSRNCEHRIKLALEAGKKNPGVLYIVSGGNIHKNGTLTEAEYMADFLKENGVSDSQIILETRSRYTRQNLELSLNIIHELCAMGEKIKRIGVVTGGFHIPRTRFILENMPKSDDLEYLFFPAYGPNTKPDNWFDNQIGREVVLSEIRKRIERKSWPGYYDLLKSDK
jgi:Glycosyltransferases involved in cell wall biogenesis